MFKTKEGQSQHPDRDAQFSYINDLAGQFLADDLPVVSADTKKRELVGEYVNKGRGFVSVGVDHDTAAFAVNAIRLWWQQTGSQRYPRAGKLMVTADRGGSNGYRRRAWKMELATLAAETGLNIVVCHFPPGTSKWNKVEHCLFSFISINWRGRPLTDYQVNLEVIANTTTAGGLTVTSHLDTNIYPTGIKISNAEFATVPVTPHGFHGDWNYSIACGQS